jgi:hypothetical protein
MMVEALVAASLAVHAAADAMGVWPPSNPGANLRHLSVQQKNAVLRPLVETANACIARNVSADPRYSALALAGEVNELIVESVPSCVDAMRNMIEAHDRVFGEGEGERFFMGPYLDALPSAVRKLIAPEQ